MNTTVNQFELLPFKDNTFQKAPKRSYTKVLAVAAVVLLATGAYFYGASTTKATNHKGFFTEYSRQSPRRTYGRTTTLSATE